MTTGTHIIVEPKSGCLRMSSIGAPTMMPQMMSRIIGWRLRNWLKKSESTMIVAMKAICEG